MKQVPIMLLSDAPDTQSGLGRITRDLATLLSRMPEFRVATSGLGGRGAAEFPWQQYHIGHNEFGELSLPAVWENWTQGEAGVLLTIWDLSRLLWLCQPKYAPEGLKQWLEGKRSAGAMKVWSYVPLDAWGPHSRLTGMEREALAGSDRLLAYSPFGKALISDTIGTELAVDKGIDWMPHGISLKHFNPEPRLANQHKQVGCLMTNQRRKDWGLCAAVCYDLVAHLNAGVRFWWHVDMRHREWNLDALVEDFGLQDYVTITEGGLLCDDAWLAQQYRACDITFLPSLGEGYGYPLFESLACGVPVVHGDYAGGASLMRSFGLERYLVEPVAYRLEGALNCVRPVYDPRTFSQKIIDILAIKPEPAWLAGRVEHLDWMKLGHRWKQWFREGLCETR